MKIKTFSTTIVSDVPISYEIKEALAKKFNCDVEIGDNDDFALTYDWCSDITKDCKNFKQDFMKVVTDTEKKSKKAEEIEATESREWMDAWKFPKLNKVTGKTCNPNVVSDLLRVCTLLGNYAQVEYDRGQYSMGLSYAMDCKALAVIHNLYAAGKFHQAAKALRELDTIVRDYIIDAAYNEIMKVY